MHHALEIREILDNILSNFSQPALNHPRATSDLATLARTCRTFKEPALDALWRVLFDLTPLARCLPQASHPLSTGNEYSFSRPLTQTEWDILQDYTRRIQSMYILRSGLDWESVAAFLNPPTTKSMFPNLRSLRCRYATETMPLLDPPLPLLVDLLVTFDNPHLLQNSRSYPNFSPDITTLDIRVDRLEGSFVNVEPNYFHRWQNLRSVHCSQLVLNIDHLAHLSRMPALTEFDFALSDTLTTSSLPLVFSKLLHLTMRSESLSPISRLLSQAQMPLLLSIRANVIDRPFSSDLTSFLARVPTSNIGHTIEKLQLDHPHRRSGSAPPPGVLLTFEDLSPCMVLGSLRRIELDIECDVSLTDSQALTLASSWPILDHLFINAERSWSTTASMTPSGLVRLLEKCLALDRVVPDPDARGHTEVPPGPNHVPELTSLSISIDVFDSTVEGETPPTIASFYCVLACSTSYLLYAWRDSAMAESPRWTECGNRWCDAYRRASRHESALRG